MIMRTFSPTVGARRISGGWTPSVRIWLCCALLLVFAAALANAQVPVNPTTNTLLFSGPGPESLNTGPTAGIIMYGTAISAITGQPVRHLWVADTIASICRMDPEIDAPGPWNLNPQTCTFQVNSGGAAVPIGGEFAYDAARKFLYFVDNEGATQGIIRIGFDPAAGGGHGMLDFSTAFTLGGATDTFIGGTGCPLPGNPGQPSALALSPLGDIWVGFATSGEILRFNSPGTATANGFGSCDQFVQLVATTPDNALTTGLAWIGHDLWGADGVSPYVIINADTACLVPPSAACSTANGKVASVLPQIGVTLTLHGDQVYPAINGNNLYFGIGSDVAWLGNVAGGPAASTLTLTYMNTAGIVPAPAPPLAGMVAMAVDTTDPANIVVYTADDPAAAVVPPLLGQARWWQTTQTSAGPAAPGTPLDVIAVAGSAQATVTWSPAQVAQPITSYTVHTFFTSDASVVPDVIVNPAPGGIYPPTSIMIPGLTNGVTYSFQVSATNANGTSALSAPSNFITLPGTAVPGAPTGATAVAGDTQAFVTWTVSTSNGGSPITSYTITGNPGGIVVTVPPPAAQSNTGGVLIGGLTNGVSYTFTVHATNSIGNSAESAPSNAVTPSAANLPTVTIAMTGQSSVTATPAQLTYNITLTNTSNFPAANISVADTLSTVPAGIASVSRAGGVVTVTTTVATSFAVNQLVTIAGVTDPSFNGTFTITHTPANNSFTFNQAGVNAVSGSGTATIQPTANILAIQIGQGSCTSGGPGVSTFSCNVGAMAAGAVVRISVIVQMQSQTITNSATVSGTDVAGTAIVSGSASKTTLEPTPPPSTGGVTADLQVTGKAARGSTPVNTANSFNWVVSNKGPATAPSTVFTDVLPATLQFSSVTTTQGVCVGPAVGSLGGTVTCTVPAFAIGAFTVNVNVIVKATGNILNTGSVSFNGTEAKPGDNSFTVKISGQ